MPIQKGLSKLNKGIKKVVSTNYPKKLAEANPVTRGKGPKATPNGPIKLFKPRGKGHRYV